MAARSDEIRLPAEWGEEDALRVSTARGAASRALLPPGLLVGGALIALVIFKAIFAGLLAPYPPDQLSADALLMPPSTAHPFGTDALGRDVFSRVVYGARLALRLSLLAAAISALPGTLLGVMAGFYRGWVDQLFSRLMDAWLALPGLLLALLIIARTGPSLDGAILALGVAGIPGFYRLARANAISLSQQQFLEATRALGAGDGLMIVRHILPNMISSLVVLVTMRLGTYLLAGGGLSFIGLGAQPPAPEWGAMLAEGRDYVDLAWWMFAFPLLAITLTVLGFNLLGDGIRDQISR